MANVLLLLATWHCKPSKLDKVLPRNLSVLLINKHWLVKITPVK
jgi:hypothetical protein